MIRGLKYIIPLSLLLAVSFDTSAQCKGFVKRNCTTVLEPYIGNGQMLAAQLRPEESIEMRLNFHQGISYRIAFCSDPSLGPLSYELKDVSGNVFHGDTLKKDDPHFLNLRVTQSTAMVLIINVPKNKNTTGIVSSGCVSAIVGFKED